MANRFWVGDGGNWSDDDNHWATSTGGAAGDGNLPTSSDNVYFDANSFSSGSQTVTVNESASCADMDWTGVTSTPALSGTNYILVYGSLTFVSGMSISGFTGGLYFYAAANLTTAGQAIKCFISVRVGSLTLQDALDLSGQSFDIRKDFTTNNNNVTTGTFELSNADSATINLGSSTITITGTNYGLIDLRGTNLTINAGTSAFVCNSTIWDEVYLGGYTINNLTAQNDAKFLDTGVVSTLTLTEGKTYTFANGETTTLTTLSAVGSLGNLITLVSDSAGTQFALSKSSGRVTVNYCDIKDSVATGGASWYAINSTNSGNNSGWDFRVHAAPAMFGDEGMIS